MGRIVGIFGTAGFGREVMALVRRQLDATSSEDEPVYVAMTAEEPVNSASVIAEDEFFASNSRRAFVIAIADARIRRRLHERAIRSGAEPLDVRAASAEVLGEVSLGEGAILCGHSSITCNTSIGRGFHLNVSSYLAHDCVVGDFVTFGPNVVCAGNVIVEDDAYLGAGALVRQGSAASPVIVGAGATIGMGAVVTRSVPPGSVVVGNPARLLKKDRPSDE